MARKTEQLLALEEAIKKAGGIALLAAALTKLTAPKGEKAVTKQRVWNWLRRDKRAPPKWCYEIEKITGTPKERLRGDIYRKAA